MILSLPNQILVERPDFAFIADIKYDKLTPFFSSCKMIGHDLSKCMRQLDTNNNTGKFSIVFLRPVVVYYKFVVAQSKESSISNNKKEGVLVISQNPKMANKPNLLYAENV